jgi:hypothetical protein
MVMKKHYRFLGILILNFVQTFALQADDLFRMSWHGKVYTSGPNGVVVRPFTEKDFIQKIAADNGLNPAGLIFVYRADKHDTAVVRASDGAFVADVIQMEYNYTEAKNSTDTQTVRQALLYDENHSVALGSALGTEKVKRDANGNITAYNFRGTFQYSIPENGAVYSGNFVASKRVADTSSQQDTSQQQTQTQQSQTTDQTQAQ